jgi:hypothetical protein
MKVTFEYIKTDNTKSLSSEYDKEYTQEEKDEMIEYIIDTFLPNSPFDINQYILSQAWEDYKHNKRNNIIPV